MGAPAQAEAQSTQVTDTSPGVGDEVRTIPFGPRHLVVDLLNNGLVVIARPVGGRPVEKTVRLGEVRVTCRGR